MRREKQKPEEFQSCQGSKVGGSRFPIQHGSLAHMEILILQLATVVKAVIFSVTFYVLADTGSICININAFQTMQSPVLFSFCAVKGVFTGQLQK